MADSGGSTPPGTESHTGSGQDKTKAKATEGTPPPDQTASRSSFVQNPPGQSREESQRTDDDTQPESGSPLSISSSIENIAEGDQEEIVDESYCSVEFEMKSLTCLQDDHRKELEYDTETDKQNGTAVTDSFNKAKTQDFENEDENRQDTHNFNKKESGKSEPPKDSSVSYRYTLRQVCGEYFLLANNSLPFHVPELNGKSNVSVKEDFICINGKLEYFINNKSGKIIITKVEEVQLGDVSKEIQKFSPSPVARHDHGEEEITSDSKVRTAKATKIRASPPRKDELMKMQDDEKSRTDKCSQPVVSIDTGGSLMNSVEGEKQDLDLEMVTNLMGGMKIEGGDQIYDDGVFRQKHAPPQSTLPDEAKKKLKNIQVEKDRNIKKTQAEKIITVASVLQDATDSREGNELHHPQGNMDKLKRTKDDHTYYKEECAQTQTAIHDDMNIVTKYAENENTAEASSVEEAFKKLNSRKDGNKNTPSEVIISNDDDETIALSHSLKDPDEECHTGNAESDSKTFDPNSKMSFEEEHTENDQHESTAIELLTQELKPSSDLEAYTETGMPNDSPEGSLDSFYLISRKHSDGGGIDTTSKSDGFVARPTQTDPSKKNKKETRQMDTEKAGHTGTRCGVFIKEKVKHLTGDPTREKTGVHHAEKPLKQKTAKSDETESDQNKDGTRAKAASNKQDPCIPEVKTERGTHGSQDVKVGTDCDDDFRGQQRSDKSLSKQYGSDGPEAQASLVSAIDRESRNDGNDMKESFCVIDHEGNTEIPINVKKLTGKVITIDAKLTDTIGKVMEKIKDEEGTAVDVQRLIFGGKQLEESHVLLDYNIGKGSTIYLVVGHKTDGNRDKVDKDRGMSDNSTRALGVSKSHLQEKTENLNKKEKVNEDIVEQSASSKSPTVKSEFMKKHIHQKEKVNEEIVDEHPASNKSPKSEFMEKLQDQSKDTVDNAAASAYKLGESSEYKASDKDKDDLEDKIKHEKENMQPTDHASVTPKEDFQKTAEDKGGTKHDDSAGMQICVTKLNKERILLDVQRNYSVAKIKAMIKDESEIFTDNWCLHFGGEKLEDENKTLADYSILHGSSLIVFIPRKTGKKDQNVEREGMSTLEGQELETGCNIQPGEPQTKGAQEKPVTFSLSLKETVEAEPGNAVRLKCIVSKPDLKAKWTFGGKPVQRSGRIRLLSSGMEHSLSIRNVVPEDAGEYGVQVGDAKGKTILNVLDKPSAPKDLTVYDITSGSCKLCWKKPENDRGSSITKYIVQWKEANAKKWTQYTCFATECMIDHLKESAQYMFHVAARNRFGTGEFTAHTVLETNSGTQAPLSESGSFEVLTSAITEEESQMEDTRYSSIDPPIRPMLEETKPEHVISYTDNCKFQKEEDVMSPGAEVYQHSSAFVVQNSGMSEPEKNETLKYELKKINGRYFLKKGSEKKVLPERFDHAKEVSLNDDDLIFADKNCYRITEENGSLVLVDTDEVPCIERQTQPPVNAYTVPTSSHLQRLPTSEKCKPKSDIYSDSEMKFKSEIEIQKPSKDIVGRNVWNNSAKENISCEKIYSTTKEETQTDVDELTKKIAPININEKPVTFSLSLKETVEVEPGNAVRLKCIVSKPDLKAKWTFGGKPVQRSERIRLLSSGMEHSLSIRNVVLEDAGEYFVRVGDAQGKTILNVLEGAQEETGSDEIHYSVGFEMKSLTYLQDDCRMESENDTGSDKRNDTTGTDDFNKPKRQHFENQEGSRHDPQSSSNKESGKSEPPKDYSGTPRYTLEQIKNEYILITKDFLAVKVPQLHGKSDVSILDDCILISGEVEYLISNESGEITLSTVRKAQSRDFSKEIQKFSPSLVSGHDHGVGEIPTDSEEKTAKVAKKRATTPKMKELMKMKDDEKSKTDKCSQPVASINTDDLHMNSDEGEEQDLDLEISNLMGGIRIEDPMSDKQRQQEYNNRQPVNTSEPVKTDEGKQARKLPIAAPRKKHQEMPSAPKQLIVSEVTSKSCQLHWQKPESSGGSSIKSYLVQMREANKTDWIDAGTSVSTHIVISSLKRKRQYLFRVAAENEYLTGEFAEIIGPITTTDAENYQSRDSQNRYLEPTEDKNMECYVLVKNVPKGCSSESLWRDMIKPGFPVVPPELIYHPKEKDALLICNSKADAAKLCKLGKFHVFEFEPHKPCLHYPMITIDRAWLQLLASQQKYEEFVKKMKDIHVHVFPNGTIKAGTTYQLKVVKHIISDWKSVEIACKAIDNVSDDIWNVVCLKKQARIGEFTADGGNIEFKNGKILLSASNKDLLSDILSVLQTYVNSLSKREFLELPVYPEKNISEEDIKKWCSEIEEELEQECCVYNPKTNMVLAFCKTYENNLKIKHLLRVKMGEIKSTARGKRFTKESKNQEEPVKTKKKILPMRDDVRERDFFQTKEGIKVYVYVADILNLDVDCIVNAANDRLQHGGGVAAVIQRGAGYALKKASQDYISKHGKLKVGQACTTRAGDLSYKCVIHAVGPCWSDYYPHNIEKVRECGMDLMDAITNSFLEAEHQNLKSIALPVISSAIFGVPEKLCTYHYVKATVLYSGSCASKSKALKEIHFIDGNEDIIAKIRNMFEDWLGETESPPDFDINEFISKESGRSANSKKHEKSLHEKKIFPEVVRSYLPTPLSYEVKWKSIAYLFCGVYDQKIIATFGNIFDTKASAIVVTIDEYGEYGALGKEISKNVCMSRASEYRRQLSSGLRVNKYLGGIIRTHGFDCGYNFIIHAVFPYHTRRNTLKQRQIDIQKTYWNIFCTTYMDKDISSVVFPLIGIGKSQEETKMCAGCVLNAYIRFCKERLTRDPRPFEISVVCNDVESLDVLKTVFDKYVMEVRIAEEVSSNTDKTTSLGATVC